MLSKVELMTAMPRAGGIYYFLDRSLGSALGTIGVSNTFLEETKLGVTPMARGVALPHMRLHGPNAPHILLLRAREGVTVNAAGHLRGDDPEAQVVHARDPSWSAPKMSRVSTCASWRAWPSGSRTRPS